MGWGAALQLGQGMGIGAALTKGMFIHILFSLIIYCVCVHACVMNKWACEYFEYLLINFIQKKNEK